MTTRTCPFCHKALSAESHHRQMYCDSACKVSARNARHKERYQADADYRIQLLEYQRRARVKNHRRRLDKNRKNRERYASDPKIRQAACDRAKRNYDRNREQIMSYRAKVAKAKKSTKSNRDAYLKQQEERQRKITQFREDSW